MPDLSERARRVESIHATLLTVFLLVGISLLYWGVPRSTALAGRADNPRRVEAELRIQRGRILDSNGVVLAETVGPLEDPRRAYPIPEIGPAIGYYSFRHGTAGVEEGYNSILRGDSDDVWEAFWRQNLHRAQVGRDIRLTLNAEWQRAADALLGEHDGAVVLLTLPEGTIGAMASHPGYDPNKLDENFETLVAAEDAPLLNRATQGRYQPGLVLQPLLLATAVEAGLLTMTDNVEDAGNPVTVHGQRYECQSEPGPDATWLDVLQHVCPNPMLNLAEPFEPGDLTQTFERFGLLSASDVPLTTAAPAPGTVDDVQAAVLGQDILTVTPLQAALAWAALANNGQFVPARLVAAVQDETGVWSSIAPTEAEDKLQAVSSRAAQAVLAALPQQEGLIAEHATTVLSGPDGSMNSWYLGLAPAGVPHYAVVVVIEDSDRLSTARHIGRSLLSQVLAPE